MKRSRDVPYSVITAALPVPLVRQLQRDAKEHDGYIGDAITRACEPWAYLNALLAEMRRCEAAAQLVVAALGSLGGERGEGAPNE
jgi:hypothetical protein